MKIGFLSMSGIRAHDPELLKLGLTLPGFVRRSKLIASLPSLGLLYIAAVTPAGHDLHYFEAEGDGKEPADVYKCGLVAINTFSAQVFEAYAIANRLREQGVKVAIGGLHASVLPDEALQHCDYVIAGEGEMVWPAVVHAAQRGEPARIFHSRDFPPVDVATLPVPRYDLLSRRQYNRFTVQTTRGCPFQCEFCASTIMLNSKFRKRPVEHVIRDIQTVAAIFPRPFIEFADDNTFVDHEWGKDLCRALIPLGIKWFTETDITIANDPQLLELMRLAGCRQVLIGVESPTRPALEGVELRTNAKARWCGRNADAIAAIHSHGVSVNGCFILGLDGHTTSIFSEVLQFAEDTGLYDVQVTYLTAFPGTPLYARLLSENRILEPGRWDLCTLFDINHQPRGMTARELRDGMHWLIPRLYDKQAVTRRRTGFHASPVKRLTGRS